MLADRIEVIGMRARVEVSRLGAEGSSHLGVGTATGGLQQEQRNAGYSKN